MERTRRTGVLVAILLLALVFWMQPVAQAAEVSVLDENELRTAIGSAAEATTIRLGADIHITGSAIEIPAGKNITLDLNGKKVTVEYNDSTQRSLYAFNNNGTFTLMDGAGGGSITARGIQNLGSGVMTINGGSILSCDTNGGGAIWNEANLTINSGTLTTSHVGTPSDQFGPCCLNNSGTALITGGTFDSVNRRAYAIISTGNLEITPASGSDVVVQGAHGGLAVDAGVVVVNGGSYTSTDYYGLYASNDGKGADPERAAVTINGGTFTGKSYSVWVGSDVHESVNSTVKIVNGTFTKPLNAQSNTKENAIVVEGGEFYNPVEEKYLDDNAAEASLTKQGETRYYVGQSNEIGEKLASKVEAGDELTVTKGDADLTALPEGVKVVNQGNGTVTVNGANGPVQVGQNEEVTTATPTQPTPTPTPTQPPFSEPDYYPDYDEDADDNQTDGSDEEQPALYSVTCRTLNVRSGAGTNFNKIGTLSRGMLVSGEVENGWLKFDYNGQTGYCSAEYLQAVGESSLEGLAVTCRTLNVRAGAGTNFEKIGTLSRGTEIKVLEVLSGWYKIEFNGGVGYVSAAYIA